MSDGTSNPHPGDPDEAIAELLAGNLRYASGRISSTNPPEARAALAGGQAPFAALIRCADSRVAPEIIFDQPLGSLFVTAVAGNLVTTEIVASLEYAVEMLGSKLVVVMGHSGCGAVESAIKFRNRTDQLPGSLPTLIDQVTLAPEGDAEDDRDGDLRTRVASSVVANADHGARRLRDCSPLLRQAEAEGRIRIIAGVLDMEAGRFQITRS